MADPATAESKGRLVGCTPWLIGLGGVMFLLCAGPLVWWFGREAIATRDLDAAKQSLVREGYPVNDETLANYRMELMPMDRSDAWVRILEAVESPDFTKTCFQVPIVGVVNDEQTYVIGQPWAHADAVREFLERHRSLLDEIHAVTAAGGPIWTPVELDSFETVLSNVTSTRSVARLLSLERMDATIRDDPAAVATSLRSLIGAARAMECEPFIVIQLVHSAVHGVATDAIRETVQAGVLSPEQRRDLLDQLCSVPSALHGFPIAIHGERAMALTFFDDPQSSGRIHGPPSLSRSYDAMQAMKWYDRILRVPIDDLNAYGMDMQRTEDELDAFVASQRTLGRMSTVMTKLLIPAIGTMGSAFTNQEMRMRIAKVSLASLEFQSRLGRWPESVDELDDLDLPLGDLRPIGNKPFGLRVVDGDLVVWGFSSRESNETPDDPLLLEGLESYQRNEREYWTWRLPRSK